MAEETNVSQSQPEPLRTAAEEARSGLGDKAGGLVQEVKDTWQSATAAVSDSVESVKATVERTVQAVPGAVHDTTAALGRAFDLPAHVRRHPWLVVGGALLLGVVVGKLVGRWRR